VQALELAVRASQCTADNLEHIARYADALTVTLDRLAHGVPSNPLQARLQAEYVPAQLAAAMARVATVHDQMKQLAGATFAQCVDRLAGLHAVVP
jgi:hypothetical protein